MIIPVVATFFLLGLPSGAQPGDPHFEFRLRSFKEIQDSIQHHPDQDFYRWARIQLLFRPYFDLHTKPTEKIEEFAQRYMDMYRDCEADSITVMMRQPCDMCPNIAVRILNPAKEMLSFLTTHERKLIKDLDQLIEKGEEIKAPWNYGSHYSANKSSFLLTRGQFLYVTGKKDEAIQDFLKALDANPSKEIKREIYISIAAYYYSSDLSIADNSKKALKYLDLVDPNDSRYSQEKIQLLFSMKDTVFVIDYFQERSAQALQRYLYLLNERETGSDPGYEEVKSFDDYKKYEKLIFEYLKKIQVQVSREDVKKQWIELIEKTE